MNLDDSYILLRVDDEKVIDFDFNDDCKIVTVKLGSDMIQEVSLSYEDIYSIFKGWREGDISLRKPVFSPL